MLIWKCERKNGRRPIDYGNNTLSTPRYVISGAGAGTVHAKAGIDAKSVRRLP